MRKNLIRIIIIALLLSLLFTIEIDATTTRVKINNQNVSAREVAVVLGGGRVNTDPFSYINNGSTYVPVRFISEFFGANVEWIGKSKSVIITKGSRVIDMSIDNSIVNVNGEMKTIAHGAQPRLVNVGGSHSHTYIPLRFVSEALGLTVGYNENLKLPTIDDNKTESSQNNITINLDTNSGVAKINILSEETLNYEEINNGEWIAYIIKNAKLKEDNSYKIRPFRNFTVEEIGSDIKITFRLDKGYSNKLYNLNASKKLVIAPRFDFPGVTMNGDKIIISICDLTKYNSFELDNPKRFVFDLYDVNLGQNIGEKNYIVSSAGITVARAGQYNNGVNEYNENIVRIVLDASDGTKIDVKETANEIIINSEYEEPLILETKPVVNNNTNINTNTNVNNYTPNSPYPEKMDKSKNVKDLLIGIDPGHGGKDPGAVANGIREKDVTIEVSKKVQNILESRGYKVYMTRSSDIYVDFRNIGSIVNNQGVDVFVSIHANSAGSNTSAHGIETYSERGGVKSKKLAQMIQKELIEGTGALNRGAKEANFAVLSRSDMPSALVELGFLTNQTEAYKLIDGAYQDIQAKAIADGIEKFILSEW